MLCHYDDSILLTGDSINNLSNEKKEVILNIQNGFAQAAQELTKVDKIRIQKLKSKPQTELKKILSENILNITEKQQKILNLILILI